MGALTVTQLREPLGACAAGRSAVQGLEQHESPLAHGEAARFTPALGPPPPWGVGELRSPSHTREEGGVGCLGDRPDQAGPHRHRPYGLVAAALGLAMPAAQELPL
jgi:hypothetical protein